MVASGRVTGIILLAIGLIVALGAVVWLGSGISEGTLRGSGFALGLVIVLILVLPLVGGGIYLMVKGQSEAKEYAEIEKERKVLNMVETQGQVKVADVALELKTNRDQVKEYIYDLVGKGLFTGYINWNDGVLYAKTASEVSTTKCPNCGGVRELVGKGVVKCPYCGAEIFIP
ncbi:MAG: zinc ribbon domain-containing protein [Chloroflexi bacterium]|nr:zinc ribbon domain-containing protein [Chloroflexota bacterium]